jgi:hypothetical protein
MTRLPRRPGTAATPQSRPGRAGPPAPAYQLKLTLVGVEPPIWQRLRAPGDLSLECLHAFFQRAMGWQDSHLHEWTVSGRRYGQPEPDCWAHETKNPRS